MKRVMVVDDSDVSCMLVKAIIEAYHPKWQIVIANSAGDALKFCENSTFDFITLDMNMPGQDGLTVAPQLKEACPNVVIALLTGETHERIKLQAEKLGLIFISKPITDLKIKNFLQDNL